MHEQVDCLDIALGVVGVDQELFEPLNLGLEMIESERHAGVIFVSDDEAITLRDINFADLEACLHETARA